MNAPTPIPRREFLAKSTLTAAALAFSPKIAAAAAESPSSDRFQFIVFDKPFQNVGFEQTADIVAEVGWNGIECPVREKGQILPERVEEDLPKLVEALKKRGLAILVLTSDIVAPNARAEKVLRTAKALGIQRYRIGFSYYDLAKPIAPQLADAKAAARDLAALNRDLGLQGGFQNHSGPKNIGAPIWDIRELVHDLDPAHLGICFDIGHATIEGGYAWPIHARAVEPFFTAIYVKDFTWQKASDAWKAKWCPLGEGMVHKEFFAWLKTTAYRGPISQHFEYQEGAGPEQIAAMKGDLATLKGWLAAAA
jgi:sugar phosphate isomerase/epimerase